MIGSEWYVSENIEMTGLRGRCTDRDYFLVNQVIETKGTVFDVFLVFSSVAPHEFLWMMLVAVFTSFIVIQLSFAYDCKNCQ